MALVPVWNHVCLQGGPLLGILGGWTNSSGLVNAAIWLTTRNGLFLCSLIVIVLASSMWVWNEMVRKNPKGLFLYRYSWYCHHVLMLLANTNEAFITAFNTYSTKFFGAGGSNVYEGILAAAAADGYVPQPVTNLNIRGSLAFDSSSCLFQYVGQLGSHPVRRSTGRQRIQKKLRLHVLGISNYRHSRGHHDASFCQNHRLGILSCSKLYFL